MTPSLFLSPPSWRSPRRQRPGVACVLLLCLALFAGEALAQSPDIRINQVGYYPSAPKHAVVAVEVDEDPFHVVAASGDTVLTGSLSAARVWAPSEESVRVADFSGLRQEGTFSLHLTDGTASYPFRIAGNVHEEVARAAVKGFYFQRASTALPAEHAGPWARSAGHPDTRVMVHASAATEERPTGTIISAPRGWYDAGDYNKYVVNSGIATNTVLSIYEHFPEYARALSTNIPESGGPLPDVLAEAMWNLEWMLAMQDPYDGGVYHKLTTANFSGYQMPHQAVGTRYVVQKSTAAALNFAAVMAQASRIFRAYDPELADEMEQAALYAWQWARVNPQVYYNQGAMNQQFNPNINTGEYGDNNVTDEFAWAAMELYVTTGQDSLLAAVPNFVTSGAAPLPGWPQVRSLGYYSLLHHGDELGPEARVEDVRQRVMSLANALRSAYTNSPYRVAMGPGNFYWGSNSVAANQSIALIQAFRMTQDSTYLDAALANMDYLLGRNATGFSFVTGHGSRPARNPHHRPSVADNVADPVPGLLVGGPNPGRQDASNCATYGAAGTYPSALPALAYIDHHCSYASNEIAINWNAPLAYVAVALEAMLSEAGMPTSAEDSGRTPETGRGAAITSSYPNPFASHTTLAIELPEAGPVRLAVVDLLGRTVRVLLDETRSAGSHTVVFEAGSLPSGLYLVRLEAGPHSDTRRILLTR